MQPLALLLKSYADDFDYATRLVASYRRFNVEGLPLFVVVPDRDIVRFSALSGPDLTLMGESSFGHHLVDRPVHGLRPGYVNQEIVKLAFHELGLAEAYFTVDSEAEFLRPFGHADFLAPDGFPYSVLIEDRDLAVDPEYYRQYWRTREPELRIIWDEVGVPDPVIRTCHGHQVMSSAVLRSFVADFLGPRGWSYADALERSPFEYSWYNAWLLASGVIPVHPRDPLVKVFHTERQVLDAIASGITDEDLARGYLAVVVNGNFGRMTGGVSMGASKPEALAGFLSYGELVELGVAKLRSSVRARLPRP